MIARSSTTGGAGGYGSAMGPRRRSPERRDAEIAALSVAIVAIFVIRLFGDPGPLELIPILAAAVRFGRRGAIAAGVAVNALLVLATLIDGHIGAGGVISRVVLYGLTAWVLGYLVDERERQARELEALKPIQNALAPEVPPALPLLDVAIRYLPASPGVSGDFYLIAQGHNNTTVFVIADVVGKGIEAAKRATFVRAT